MEHNVKLQSHFPIQEKLVILWQMNKKCDVAKNYGYIYFFNLDCYYCKQITVIVQH
jgi:hypothetical protein